MGTIDGHNAPFLRRRTRVLLRREPRAALRRCRARAARAPAAPRCAAHTGTTQQRVSAGHAARVHPARDACGDGRQCGVRADTASEKWAQRPLRRRRRSADARMRAAPVVGNGRAAPCCGAVVSGSSLCACSAKSEATTQRMNALLGALWLVWWARWWALRRTHGVVLPQPRALEAAAAGGRERSGAGARVRARHREGKASERGGGRCRAAASGGGGRNSACGCGTACLTMAARRSSSIWPACGPSSACVRRVRRESSSAGAAASGRPLSTGASASPPAVTAVLESPAETASRSRP